MDNNKFNEENFADLFNQSISNVSHFDGNIVKGIIVAKDNNYLTIDVGLKSEGKVLINEFKDKDGNLPTLEIGSSVEVYVEKYENNDGSMVLSREKARREEIWEELEKMNTEGTPVNGYVAKRVKGGFAVLVHDTPAFLPGSQLDVRPIKNINALVGTTQTLQILKMDKKRFNIVVSRKAIMMQNDKYSPDNIESQYQEGQTVEGVVKNITGYGAFIDLGYVDGLLHVTDISWSRINHPSEVLQLGQTLKLQIIKINPENKRISLGLKQLSNDPWTEIVNKYTIGERFKVKVANVTDYGIFVELTKGVEGLVHVSEMSWVEKEIDPKIKYHVGDEVEVKILEIDLKKRRINLSIKQCIDNPWQEFATSNPEGSMIEVAIKDINDNGILVKLTNFIDGFVRVQDISWESRDKALLDNYKIGDTIKVKVIKNDVERDKVLLGIKQLGDDPLMATYEKIKKGDIVDVTVSAVTEAGLEVVLSNGINGFIKKYDVALDRNDQNLDNFKKGDKLKATVMQLNTMARSLALSVKALEMMETKKAMNFEEEDNNSSSFAEAFASALNKKEETDK
ncbi:30S ribosomal protein S1 [Candidatus Hepatincola sp. Av]